MEVPVELERIIYLDNAATVYPKPAEPMAKALVLYQRVGVNPGRAGFDLGHDRLEEYRKQHSARPALRRLLKKD